MSKNKSNKLTSANDGNDTPPLTCPQHPHFKTAIDEVDQAVELIPELFLELDSLYHSGRILQARSSNHITLGD